MCRLKFVRGKQKEFLENVIRAHFGNQAVFARGFGVKRKTVNDWLKEKNLLPKSVFERICSKFPECNYFEALSLKNCLKTGAG